MRDRLLNVKSCLMEMIDDSTELINRMRLERNSKTCQYVRKNTKALRSLNDLADVIKELERTEK